MEDPKEKLKELRQAFRRFSEVEAT